MPPVGEKQFSRTGIGWENRVLVRFIIFYYMKVLIALVSPFIFCRAHLAPVNKTHPPGTVILPTLSVLLGVQFMIAAIEIDLRSIPTEPLSTPL